MSLKTLLTPYCCRRMLCPDYSKHEEPGPCPTCGQPMEIYDRPREYARAFFGTVTQAREPESEEEQHDQYEIDWSNDQAADI